MFLRIGGTIDCSFDWLVDLLLGWLIDLLIHRLLASNTRRTREKIWVHLVRSDAIRSWYDVIMLSWAKSMGDRQSVLVRMEIYGGYSPEIRACTYGRSKHIWGPNDFERFLMPPRVWVWLFDAGKHVLSYSLRIALLQNEVIVFYYNFDMFLTLANCWVASITCVWNPCSITWTSMHNDAILSSVG